MRPETSAITHVGLLTLLVVAVFGWGGCSKGRHDAGAAVNPPMTVSEVDARVVQMLAELQRVGTQLNVAPIPIPLPDSAEMRIQPSLDGTNANLYYFAEGTARIIHFSKFPDGYRWHGEIQILLPGDNTNLPDLLSTLPEVRRTLAKWDEQDHRPKKPHRSENLGVNNVRSASITLRKTNAP